MYTETKSGDVRVLYKLNSALKVHEHQPSLLTRKMATMQAASQPKLNKQILIFGYD